MDFARFNNLLLQSVGVGLALFDGKTEKPLLHNQRLLDWFPGGQAKGALMELFPQIERDAMERRLAAGKAYVFDCEVKVGPRTLSLNVQVSRHESKELSLLMVECQNVSKIRELEYMIQSYSSMVEKQNRDLQKEKDRVEKVLLNIMPKTVYEEWKQFGVTTPQRYERCSLMMLDFVGSTEMAISADPPALISELNDVFTAFDRIVEQFGCERLKTIGDAYVAISGIPESSPDHAKNIAGVALRIVHFLKRRNQTNKQQWRCRIGINSGAVIGSIVGVQKYVYDVFGPGINLAARLEAQAEAMEILLCDDLLQHLNKSFEVEPLGEREIRGFGKKQVYRLIAGEDITI